MKRPLFRLAEKEERRIRELSAQEPWKREHEKVMRLYGLEHAFTALKNSVEVLFKADNHLHRKAATTGDMREIDAWIPVFDRFVKASITAVREIRADAKAIGADSYGSEALASKAMNDVLRRLSDAADSLKEWRGWKEPTRQKARP